MQIIGTIMPFDEPTCRAVMDSPITEWVQQPYGRFGEMLLPELVFDMWPIWTWTGEVVFEPKCSRRFAQDDHRVGPITRLKELWQWLFASPTDLRQRLELYLGDGRRLPLPQVIRRSNRTGHEAKTTSGDSGADDDEPK
jgi:hypothetical protein